MTDINTETEVPQIDFDIHTGDVLWASDASDDGSKDESDTRSTDSEEKQA